MPVVVLFLVLIISYLSSHHCDEQQNVLDPLTFKHYIDEFNAYDNDLYGQHIPNSKAWEFLELNIPFFDCPDKTIERTYYFRWWTYRKHIKLITETPGSPFYVITEFLPDVPWSGLYNTISCAAAHHFRDGDEAH
jgi:hypothetical protein